MGSDYRFPAAGKGEKDDQWRPRNEYYKGGDEHRVNVSGRMGPESTRPGIANQYNHSRDDVAAVRQERSRSRSPWRKGKPTRHEKSYRSRSRERATRNISPGYKPRSRSPWRANKPTRARERSLSISSYSSSGKSWSRSPPRGNSKTSGAAKRSRDDDHYSRKDSSDPRRFKVRYEETERPLSRQAQPDSDRHQHPNGAYSYEDRRGRNPHPPHNSYEERGRARERSRSPFRHKKHNAYEQKSSGYRGVAPGSLHANFSNGQVEPRNQGQKGYAPSVHQSEYTPRMSQEQTQAKVEISLSQHSKYSTEEAAKQRSAQRKGQPGEQVEDTTEPLRQLSDAEIIEERRKKREAIRAKHKTEAPLLVQALEQNATSTPHTPAHYSSGLQSEQQSPPSSIDSPRTPAYSPPGSPSVFTVNNDEELVDRRTANDGAHEEEGPSAADYDPNLDMEEDRPDHKRHDVQASAIQGGAIKQQEQQTKTAPKQPKEYDMFADDDDYDMFAPEDMSAQAVAGGIKQGRALDANMLDNWDYPDGHYRIIVGELLNDRYAVQQQIGKGTFATVIRAQDTRTGNLVAVKIACNNDTMYKAGQTEMDMLSLLNKNDPEDKKHIIQLLGHFDHKGHLCLVFENLSDDLREVLKKFGRNVGINIKAIRAYAQQLFLSLSHLKKCQILHADLKPDNILVSEKRSLLKICDLGTASFADDAEVTPYLVSRFYRAPEVILGMPFDYAIDMWSIGCTLFELYTGRICFAGADNNQMLRAIQECRGKLPIRMLKRSTLAEKHFDIDGNFYSQERDKITGKATVRQINFNKTAPGKDLRARLNFNTKGMLPEEAKEHATFVDLIEKCLQLDPVRRVSPNDALRHNFVTHGTTVQPKKVVPTMKPATKVPKK